MSGAVRDIGGSGGCGGVRGVLGLAGSVHSRGPEWYRWHQVALGAPRGSRNLGGCYEASGGVGGVRCVLGVGRECRYSGARRGIGDIREHWRAPRVYWGAGRECRY